MRVMVRSFAYRHHVLQLVNINLQEEHIRIILNTQSIDQSINQSINQAKQHERMDIVVVI